MRILVLQRHRHILDGLRMTVERMDAKRAKEIQFTSDPEAVFPSVAEVGQPVLIVTGQILPDGERGTSLARAIKLLNPYALVFIYCVMPATNEAVDGVIHKDGDEDDPFHFDLVARILTSDLEGATPASLKERFPEIQLNEARV